MPRSRQIRKLKPSSRPSVLRNALDNMLMERRQNGELSPDEAISKIMKLRQQYIEARYIFIKGGDLLPLLRSLGTKDDDIQGLVRTSDALTTDPTLPFRKTRNGRFCIDPNTQSVRRLEYQPFILTPEEDFKRYDSGRVRSFDQIKDDVQLNSLLQSLLRFHALVVHGVETKRRPNLDYDLPQWICTLFHVRTTTTTDILGEPALEGVHTDGVDHTMTTFLDAKNMASHSAETMMHDMSEKTGIKASETRSELICGRVQHRDLLDTLLFADNERKHSLSPLYAVNGSRPAQRDMLVFFTRKPVTAQHVSASMDSLRQHMEMPMEVSLLPDSKGVPAS